MDANGVRDVVWPLLGEERRLFINMQWELIDQIVPMIRGCRRVSAGLGPRFGGSDTCNSISAPAHRSVQQPLIDMCLGVMPLSLRGVSRRDAFQSAANLGRIGSALLAQPRTQVDVSPVPEDTSTGLFLACLPVRIKTRQGGLEVASSTAVGWAWSTVSLHRTPVW